MYVFAMSVGPLAVVAVAVVGLTLALVVNGIIRTNGFDVININSLNAIYTSYEQGYTVVIFHAMSCSVLLSLSSSSR